jgi:hypothetical protein
MFFLLFPQLIGLMALCSGELFSSIFYTFRNSFFFCRTEMNRDASLPLPFANFCLKRAKFFFADYEVSDLKFYEGLF